MIYNRPEYWLKIKKMPKPDGDAYLTFASPNVFSISVSTPGWDGTLSYFTEDEEWTTWDGTSLKAKYGDGGYVVYLRGTGNTKITGSSNDQAYKWEIAGSNIQCDGNIETLLDYSTVETGKHPSMASSCYQDMFRGCTSLTQAPALPATTLAMSCYGAMFYGCVSLTQAPKLPATTLANNCYASMFRDCTGLNQAPALPATTLEDWCYYRMFYGCTGLTRAPELPATTLNVVCYESMFYGCTGLTQAPALPATTLADYCYYDMFESCNSLVAAPTLPATALTKYCYAHMFSGCTSLTQAPKLPATTLGIQCYAYMFRGCTKIKLSETQTGEYTQAYRIPTSGTGATEANALMDMFTNTGGTFTGTPEINTTYYLSNTNTIV